MSVKDKISRVKRSKDARTLAANFGYLSLLQIAGYVFPLFTLPYLARVIGADGFGKIAFASAIIVWFETIADWGFNFTATRDVAQNRDNKEKVSEIFSTVFWGRLLLMGGSLLLLLLLILIIPKFKANAAILLITFLQVPGNALLPQWFFQGLERMKYITWFTLLTKLLFTVAVFVFVRDKDDYIIQPLLWSIGSIISGLISMNLIIGKWKYSLHTVHVNQIIKTIKSSTDVFINNLAPNLYNSFSVALLGFLHTDAIVGIYDAGMKFMRIAYQFMGIVSRTVFPFLARRIDRHDIFQRYYILLAVCATVVLLVFAPQLIKLFYGSEFVAADVVLRIVSFAIIPLALGSVFGTNYLILIKKEKLFRNITVVSSLIGFVSAFPLVYYFDYIGTACVFLFSNSLIGFVTMYYALKIKKSNTLCC